MILQTVLRTVQHYKLLSANQTLIIGVSGGTDSLALLHIMKQLEPEFGIPLHIASLNHGIRGQDAESDVQFVKDIAGRWSLPYTVGQADVPQMANQLGIGLEEAGRKARYDFLSKVAEQQQTTHVAVAHHANDQAETIMMHIIRGSGLNGMRGMTFSSPMPYHPHIRLIRPLLQVTRQQLESYCVEHDLSPRYDKTNENVKYQRNYIRHKIMPLLQQINPNIVRTLGRLGNSLQVDNDFIETQFDLLVMLDVKQDENRWVIDREQFNQFHQALQRRLIRYAYKRLSSGADVLKSDQVKSVIDQISEGQVGTGLDLGEGIRFRLGYSEVYFENEAIPIENGLYRLIPVNTDLELHVPEKIVIGDVTITTSRKKPTDINSQELLVFPQNIIIKLRTRRDGDRFKPIGMGGHTRKIKDWMIDRKIPRQFRNQIPLITVNDQIIAICVGTKWHLSDVSQFIVNGDRNLYLILN